ncbi:MAG TPA: phosphotransferase family protein, partial [Acidimicrobiia bacterium]|nr:phosphotransferase family protein [Acidimicrobiia bacterium]
MARLDPAALADVVGRHLGEAMSVEGLRRLSGGASRETWAFDVVGETGPPRALVLRRDPSTQLLGSARSTEYELIRAAEAAGVPVPTVRFLLDDADGIGTGFVMDRVEGETIPRKILRDDAYAAARAGLARRCGEIAARIHAIDVATLPELPTHAPHQEIDQYRAALDNFGEPHPAFELALAWLDDHAPPPPAAPRLVHGDFRNGNLIVGPDGLRSVLDWELAHLGDPVEDLGWLCVKSWRFGNVDRVAGGFGSVDELLAGYRTGGGTDVNPDHLRYWEAFGTLKWGVICIVQSFTHLNGLVRSVELATLGRRVAETEWDLLELLHPAPRPARFDGSVTPGVT